MKRVLVTYFALLAIACAVVFARARGRAPDRPVVIASAWAHGRRTERRVLEDGAGERVLAIGAVPAWEPLRALSFAPAVDGVRAELDGKVAWLTPDDLLANRAYDRMYTPSEGLSLGLDLELVYALLAGELGAPPSEVKRRAKLERARFERPRLAPRAEELTDETAKRAMEEIAAHLTRGLSAEGKFRFLVDGVSNASKDAYDWPRHAGTTYFLARAGSPAAKRAAERIPVVSCGARACVGDGDPVDLGSSALSLLAFVELAKTDPSFRERARSLAEFLRAQQRADGELMHFCQRDGTPIDAQTLYFSGEAALALTRAGAPEDLEAARRAVAHLTRRAWSFTFDRYLYGEEHWTCQATAELWSRAPDPAALEFCMRWLEWNASLQAREGDAPFDVDGAFWTGPLAAPRLTPVARRAEAAAAILPVARAAGASEARVSRLEAALRRSLALLVRHQMPHGVAHIVADPAAVSGGMPSSAVDFTLRVDFGQHTGAALARWLERGGPATLQ